MFLGDRKIGSSEDMESEPNGRQEIEGTVMELRAKKEIRRFSFFFFNRLSQKFVFIGQRWIQNILARTEEIGGKIIILFVR